MIKNESIFLINLKQNQKQVLLIINVNICGTALESQDIVKQSEKNLKNSLYWTGY